MVAVLQFQENLAHIGLSTRRAKLGPELDLVQRFTDYVIAAHQPKQRVERRLRGFDIAIGTRHRRHGILLRLCSAVGRAGRGA